MQTNARRYGKYYCFTYNNPEQDGPTYARTLANLATVKAFVFQRERGTEGTEHYQGYIELDRSRPFSYAKRILGRTVHLEFRRGTPQQAIDYCKKEDTRIDGPWENGEFTIVLSQGKRSDLEAVVETMQQAKSLQEVVRSHAAAAIRYSRGFQFTYKHLKAPTVHKVPKIFLYFGGTGTGKTRAAMNVDSVFKKSGSDRWFDGYDNEDTIVFDDFGGGRSRMALSDLLNYLDRYPVKFPVKGDFVDRNCTNLIITSNIHPYQWYDYTNREEHYKALARRISNVLYFTPNGCFRQVPEIFFEDYAETSTNYLSLEDRIPLPWEENFILISDDSDTETHSTELYEGDIDQNGG